jgi:hypothetical protein
VFNPEKESFLLSTRTILTRSMALKPPPLPGHVLVRVLTIATIDGRILVFLAGSFGLVSALMLDGVGAAAGLLAAAAGWLELRGVNQIKRGHLDGVNRLVASQLLVIGIVVMYALYRMAHFNLAEWQRWFIPAVRERLEVLDISVESAQASLRQLYVGLYKVVALLTLLFQGGMAWYSHRRRAAIRLALAEMGFH